MKKIILLMVVPVFFATCSKSSSSSTPVYTANCATLLAGAYTGNDLCPGAGAGAYPASITATSATTISISDLYGTAVTATVDCDHNTINIPNQNSTTFSISGSGSYTASRIIINWTATSAGLPTSCSTTYTR